ncbi:MAG: hypothetical protein QM705_09450 [Ancrocorticia sp.]
MTKECRGFGKLLAQNHRVLSYLAGASLTALILKLKLDFSDKDILGLLIWMAAILALLWAATMATRTCDKQSLLSRRSKANPAPAIGDDLILLVPRDRRSVPLTREEQQFLRNMDRKYRIRSRTNV